MRLFQMVETLACSHVDHWGHREDHPNSALLAQVVEPQHGGLTYHIRYGILLEATLAANLPASFYLSALRSLHRYGKSTGKSTVMTEWFHLPAPTGKGL
jgi:hypothetical protein